MESCEIIHNNWMQFIEGQVIYDTPNYLVINGFKPGFQDQKEGQRFYIVPLTDEAEEMLRMASMEHNVPNLTEYWVKVGKDERKIRKALRADFIQENLEPLRNGITSVPPVGEDTIPSPDRLEECLLKHPGYYSFSD